MNSEIKMSYSLFSQRRKLLCENTFYQDLYDGHGLIIIGADFEVDRYAFRQNSMFYYFTGIKEPGAVLFLYDDGREILYIPDYGGRRVQWSTGALRADAETAKILGVDEIKYLGQQCRGYSIQPLFLKREYEIMLGDLNTYLTSDGGRVYMSLDMKSGSHCSQIHYYNHLVIFFPSLVNRIEDCALAAHVLRRNKDNFELSCMNQAVKITEHAHAGAAMAIEPGKKECEIQAVLEGVFTMMGADCAFPSIVATGKNTTVLHYTGRMNELREGDLVVVDIGADYSYYAADITRTYPVSGTFSKRQKEVYSIVLDTQCYIESLAAPGMFLNNPGLPEKSLQHLAIDFLSKAGYAQYFVHGIGHYVGLDVHDVGDMAAPLEAGNVITIEPGIYIADEDLGIRIEDDYVIVDDGCLCLSESLPKGIEEIEKLSRVHE